MNIPYGQQSVNWIDVLATIKVLRSNNLTIGPAVNKFEKHLREFTGAKFSVAVSSGTAALHCAYSALDRERGDEVITSPLSFVATASAAIQSGLNVRFADIDPKSGCLDPNSVRSSISSKTIAITSVDYAGNTGDLENISSIAKQNGLVLIEDAAHSLGSTFRENFVGNIADMTVLSFFPTKNITTGEGGAVLTNDFNFFSRVTSFKMHGIIRDQSRLVSKDIGDWHQEVQALGLNYRMSDIHAALGSSQLKRINKFKAKRQKFFELYSLLLNDIKQIQLPSSNDGVDAMWHLYPIRVPPNVRKELFNHLRKMGIIVQVNYLPIYLHPYFLSLGYEKGLCPNAEVFYASEISLPMHVNLSYRKIEKITEIIRNFFR